jgi:hypothetical protein
LCRNRKDASKIALNLDLQPVPRRRQDDLVHERPQGVRGLDPPRLVVTLKRLIELLDPLAVLQGHARVQHRLRF